MIDEVKFGAGSVAAVQRHLAPHVAEVAGTARNGQL